MFKRSSERYVVIQDYVPLHEQHAIERAVVTVLTPVRPSDGFVDQLGYDLTEEARKQYEARQRYVSKALRIFGFVGGGLASVIGGIAIWLLVHRDDRVARPSRPQARAQRQAAVSPG